MKNKDVELNQRVQNVDAASDTATQDLANALGNVTIVNKGHVDIISNGITSKDS